MNHPFKNCLMTMQISFGIDQTLHNENHVDEIRNYS